MPLTHAERQKRYRDAHESDPVAKNRLAAHKRATRAANKSTDSADKKEYERGLQKVRSEEESSVRVKYMHPVGGQMSRYTWPASEDIFDTPTEDILYSK